jgi:hypothetical protein
MSGTRVDIAEFRGAGMAHDDYAAQMQAAVEREAERTAAEGNCIARTRDGDLCRRRIAKALRAKGSKHCRLHVAVPRRPAAKP